MADKKLESFKIGDVAKGGPDRPARPRQQAAQGEPEEPETLGFARIEGILENEDPERIRAELRQIVDDLTAFSATAKASKDKAAAKKAIVAVERTLALLDYLFQTKEALIEAARTVKG